MTDENEAQKCRIIRKEPAVDPHGNITSFSIMKMYSETSFYTIA